MKQIKIIYIVPYLIKSGPINVLYNIVKHINRQKYELVVVTLTKNQCPHRDNKVWFTDLGIEVIEYNYSNWYLQFHVKTVAEDIEKRFNNNNVIFHAHGYYPTLLLSRMKQCVTMTTIHNICGQDFVLQKGRVIGYYMSWMYKRALKHISLCVPICDYMKDYYYRDNHHLNLHMVYNGVDCARDYSNNEKLAIRAELGIAPYVKVLLFPAEFSYRKNQVHVIKGVRSCSRRDFIVLFAGQGDAEDECKRLAENDSRFRFLGYQMNLEKYWAITDFMISASRSEGLPMAVLEALVQGVPCLLSDIPPHIEIQQNIYGEKEFLFSITDSNDLLLKFDYFLDRKINHEFIKDKAKSLYSSEVMASHYMDLYASMI